MKITVMGGSGLVGRKVVERLTSAGHEVTAASRASGADVVTGEGLAEALAGSKVVVDVLNSPSFNDQLVMAFFAAASAHLVSAAKQAGVGHYVALSIVGVEGLPESAYMRAKVMQEKAISESGLPYSIVRATQFHEFTEAIVRSLYVGEEVRVPNASIQPIAADEVAAEVARVATATPLDGIIEIGGPEKISFADMARTVLASKGLKSPVIVDASATYFGTPVDESSLVVGKGAASGTLRLGDWLRSSQ